MLGSGSGEVSVIPASTVLDSVAGISSIRESVLGQLEGRLPGVEALMALEISSRNVKPMNDHAVTMTHYAVVLRVTVHTP